MSAARKFQLTYSEQTECHHQSEGPPLKSLIFSLQRDQDRLQRYADRTLRAVEHITDTFETKMDALYCHASQMGGSREEGIKRSRQRAAEVGENIGVSLAEGFKRVEIFR